jgi:sugar phosphate isomerase/epimerase
MTSPNGLSLPSISPRLAFSNLGAPNWSLERTVASTREYGYDGLELRLLDGEPIEAATLDPTTRKTVAQALSRADLPLVCFDSSVVLAHPFDVELSASLELAAAWGAPLVRVFGGPIDESRPRVSAFDDIARRLEPMLTRADSLDVAIALETHDAFSSTTSVAELLGRIDNPRLVAIWDLHHTFQAGESPDEAVELLGNRLAHVHVKDARRRENGWELALLGEGDVPVAESLVALRQTNYDGWISVEWEKRWFPELDEPEVALPQHASLLKRWLDSLPSCGLGSAS